LSDNTPAMPALPAAPMAPLPPEPTIGELAEQQPDAVQEQDDDTPALLVDSDDDSDDAEAAGTPDVEQADDDDEEVEWENGKKYRLPKGIKESLLRQEDYTRKTQALADANRQTAVINKIALDRAQLIDKAGAAFALQQDAINKLAEIDAKIDFRKLEAADPNAANQWWRYREQLKEFVGRTEQQISSARNELEAAQQQATAMQAENFHRVMSRDVKGWDGDLNGKIGTHAIRKLGFRKDEVESITDPRVGKALHKAFLYDQLIDKAKAPPKQANKPAAAAQQVKPTEKLGKGAPQGGARKPLEKMSTAEYIAHMNAKESADKKRDREGRYR
jgi:hypothetical protein